MQTTTTKESRYECDDSLEALKTGPALTQYLFSLAEGRHWFSKRNPLTVNNDAGMTANYQAQRLTQLSAGQEGASAWEMGLENGPPKKKKKKTSVEEIGDHLARHLHVSNVSGGPASHEGVTGCLSSVQEALALRGVDVNTTDDRGRTLLHCAVEQNNVEAVRMLLALESNGVCAIDFDARDENGQTAPMFAIVMNNEIIIQVLFKAGIGSDGKSQFDVNMPDKYKRTLLHYAAGRGNVQAVHMLLALETDGVHAVNVNARDEDERTALMKASSNGHEQVVRALLKVQKCTHDEIFQSDAELIAGASVSVATVLNTKKQHRLLRGVNVNARDDKGQTALMHAAKRGRVGIVRLLLEHNADVYACDENGNNALHWAVRGEYLSDNPSHLLDTLVDSGLYASICNYNGSSCLHEVNAARRTCSFKSCSKKIIEWLLSNGSVLGTTNATGKTVLHNAIAEYNLIQTPASLNTLRLLLGADPRVKDLWLKTALEQISCPCCRRILVEAIPEFNPSTETLTTNGYRMFYTELLLELDSTESVFVGFTENALECLTIWYYYAVNAPRDFRTHVEGCDGYNYLARFLKVMLHLSRTRPKETDRRGRTWLHIVSILLLSFDDHQVFNTLEDYLDNNFLNEAFDLNFFTKITDFYGRTALHYVSGIGTWLTFYGIPYDWFENLLNSLFDTSVINAKDRFGRTAMHYAAISFNDSDHSIDVYARLVNKGADVTLTDSFGESPEQLKTAAQNYRQSTLSARETTEFILLFEFEEFRQSCFKAMSSMHEIYNFSQHWIKSSLLVNNANCNQSFIAASIWHTDQFAYLSDVTQVLTERLNAFVVRLVAAVQAADPRLKGRVMLVGSAYEETKVERPDEFDFDVVLTEFTDVCEVSSSPVCPSGYVSVKRKTPVYSNGCCLDAFFDDEGFLLTSSLRQAFEEGAKSLLRHSTFWIDEEDFELSIRHDYELYRSSPVCVCFTLSLVVNTPINGSHVFHTLQIDIVPCIRIKSFWPDDANRVVSKSLKSDGCTLVLNQPQKVYPWIPVSIPYARVSFARAESSVIRSCTSAIKAAFMVAKCFSLLWSPSEWFNSCDSLIVTHEGCTSHALKMAVLHCMASAARNKTKRSSGWSTDYQMVTDCELTHFVRKLFYCILQFHRQDYVPSYFFPRHSVRIWDWESFLKDFSVHVHEYWRPVRDMSKDDIDESVRELFITARERDKRLRLDGSLYQAVNAFQHAHALYWMCCDEDRVPLFNFLHYANPIVENFDLRRTYIALHAA